MCHCAAQWQKQYVPLCSTVAKEICPTVQRSGRSTMSYWAAQWHKQYVPLCCTVAQATCPTVQHSGTSNMPHCAAQWHKQYVPLCSTVAEAICPTLQRSDTSNMSQCAAQWDILLVPLCCTVAQATCPTVLVLLKRKEEGVNTTLSSLCDLTQQPNKEPSYVCMSVLLKMAAIEILQNVSVILKNKKKQNPPRNYLQSPNANTKLEAKFNFRKIAKN